ncbi:MAG: ArsB/NhaD family transporter [Victivallaceae bacterium]
MHIFYQINNEFVAVATLIIFCITYIGLAAGRIRGLKLDRTAITFLGAVAMLALGCITLKKAVDSINFESVLLLFSLMVIASQLHYAGFFHNVAGRISQRLAHPVFFLGLLMTASGLLSAFLNNDVVCLAFTPVVAAALLRKRLNPVPFLIGLALASNIGCALTLIGNAQNVLIGQIGHLSFGGYMLWAVTPVGLSMTSAFCIICYLSRNRFYLAENEIVTAPQDDNVLFDNWRTIKGVGMLCIIIILFFTPLPRYLVALTGAGLLLCSHRLESKKVLAMVDWQVLLLFISLFVVVGAFYNSGMAAPMLKALEAHGIDLSNSYILAAATGILSNLINNSAAVMLLVKLLDFGSPMQGYVLAISNAFAGNLLVIGSVANIIMIQAAEASGVKISFREFARYGIPTTVLSFGILFLWIYVIGLF